MAANIENSGDTGFILAEIKAWSDVLKVMGDSREDVSPRSLYVIGEALSDKLKELYEDLGIDPSEVLR